MKQFYHFLTLNYKVAENIPTLTDAFLAGGKKLHPPVVRGTYEAANVDELPVLPEDQIVLKPRFDPFFGTDLDYQLSVRKIKTILLGGYATNFGVENCARSARDRGYDVVILSDCCYNVDRELHEWAINKILPFFSRVPTTTEKGLHPLWGVNPFWVSHEAS